jgi:inhibitor of cysteine peptidase
MSAGAWKAAIASVALAIMMPSATGFAKTAGAPAGASRASSTLLMDKLELTPQCGRFNCEPVADAEAVSLPSTMPDLIFQAEDNGRVANVPVGRRFRIRLEENPTTGYKWSKPDFDASCLRLESDEYTPYKEAGIGGGGVREFEFTATAECRTTIHLVNKRPWETSVAPTATFEITVVGTP